MTVNPTTSFNFLELVTARVETVADSTSELQDRIINGGWYSTVRLGIMTSQCENQIVGEVIHILAFLKKSKIISVIAGMKYVQYIVLMSIYLYKTLHFHLGM